MTRNITSTKWPQRVEEALKLPTGAHFIRCAFQVNPHGYASKYRGASAHSGDEPSYTSELLQKATEADIKVIAVTDHNHVGSIASMTAAAKTRKIVVFPGFELTSSEGVHVLAIYDPKMSVKELERFLGELGVRNPERHTDVSSEQLTVILRKIVEQGGLTIAAHVTSDNGLLKVLNGQSRVHAWKDTNLLAIQIPNRIDDLSPASKDIIRNQNPDYRRDPSPSDSLALAVINCHDVAKPDDILDASASCWVKMGTINIEGVKQAFLDPVSRIRLNSEPLPELHSEFVAMTWEGGFLDGAAVHFNENLNVFIGGRGAGKSTVIESIRYVLNLPPIGDDAKAAHDGIVQNVLRSGTKVSLLVRSHTPSQREYLIERTVPSAPVVKDDTGTVLDLSPVDIVPLVEVYGQHEISEIAKNPNRRTLLLVRFVETDAKAMEKKREEQRDLEKSRKAILDVQAEITRIDEKLAALPALEERLKRYQNAGVENHLKESDFVVREEQVFKGASECIMDTKTVFDVARESLPIDVNFLESAKIEELPRHNELVQIKKILADVNGKLQQAVQSIDSILLGATAQLEELRGRWKTLIEPVEAKHQVILRELQKTNIDGSEFIETRRRIEELRPLKSKREQLEKQLVELHTLRKGQLVNWEDSKAEEFRQLDRAAKKVEQQLANRVRVQVRNGGNRDPLFDVLKKIGGRLGETIDTFRNTDSISLTDIASTLREGRDAITKRFKTIPGAQADRLACAPAELIMNIEELDLPATTQIELNIAEDGQSPQWKQLESLSTGQKATAILLLLLLESEAPLVVDQPEDDLDNRFITDGIVPKMREEKWRRQFVFSTHNANIPVLGDAELIIGLVPAGEGSAGRSQVEPKLMGSIDSEPVREMVKQILEGGDEAFRMRQRKYGF